MKNNLNTHRVALAALAASLVVAACGGGGGGSSYDADHRAVERAEASSQGFLAFIASFAGRDFDNDEPYDLSEFEAPTDDTDNSAPVPTPVDG